MTLNLHMFADEVKLSVKAGNGGDGAVSFRREIYIPKGGPDGGDGGNGGNVYLQADHNETSLIKLLRTHKLKADDGDAGKGKRKTGKSGTDLIVKVPLGTQIFEMVDAGIKSKTSEFLVADLDKDGAKFLLARGGEGGFGNARFARASFQSPKFADLGIPGDEKDIILRLKLIAEVGLVGLPNAGKSTLLSVISNAKPKIADYAFTTIVPNLGIVNIGDSRFLMADIPGVIEGAHQGKGLGLDFLKHIERTKVLVHLIDATSSDIKNDFKIINNELKKYNKELANKPQVVAITKIDAIDDEKLKLIKKIKFGKFPVHYISAVAHQGLDSMLYDVVKLLKLAPKKIESIKIYNIEDLPMNRFEVTKKGKVFSVWGDRVEKLLMKTDIENEQALGRMYKILRRMGVLSELQKAGASEGDSVKIGKHTIEYKTVS